MNKIKITLCILFMILIQSISLPAAYYECFSKNEADFNIVVDYNGTGDYVNIQDAIDAASEGDIIFVKTGTYFENLVIKKSIKLIGEDKHKTIVDGGIKPTFFKKNSIVIQATCGNVEISNFTIQNATGISGRGIYILKDKGKSTTSKNIISDNIIKNCSYGLMIVNPINNTVANNSFYNCAGGFYIPKLPYYENIFENNTANDKPILQIIRKENIIVEDDAGCIILLDCKNITIQNLTTSYITAGIDISFSENITVKNCTITNTNRGGIYVHYSNNCKFIRNTFIDDNWGIFLRKSNNNQILNNNFVNITKYDWFSSAYYNRWNGNYWEKPLTRPKLIFGKNLGSNGIIPWFNIDFNPATEFN